MKTLFISLAALAVIVIIVLRLFRGRIPSDPEDLAGESKASIVLPKNISELDAFTVTLDVGEQSALFILLAADGTINRMGTGTAQNAECDLFMGKIDQAIFESVRSHLTSEMMGSLGQGYGMRNPQGQRCKLTLTFKFKNGMSSGLVFLYGSESAGPPKHVADFVRTAVAQTDPWYEDFRHKALRRKQA
jgi:hypothetical protein